LSKILEVKNLKKSFGSIEAVKNVSFDADEGEILGVIGPNGAGKTTIFNLIMGVFRQDYGNIIFLNKKIDDLKTYQRVAIGMARSFQFARTFHSITVLEHIRIVRLSGRLKLLEHADHEEQSKTIVKMVGLEDVMNKMPGELNIEMLRKLELAMAFALEPKIFFVDEMFAGLTKDESNEIIKIIKKMMKEGYPQTVLVVDHNLSALRNIVDRVVAIDLGVKIAEGTFDEVCSDEQVRKAYLGDYVM
jgi:ABC-type branched-subunit amino acid transport system ATPase component